MKIKTLLNKPAKWIKRYFAVAKDGQQLRHGSNLAAVRWCLRGAVQKCYPGREDEVEETLRRTIARLFPDQWKHNSVSDFNNAASTKFADIRKVILAAKV